MIFETAAGATVSDGGTTAGVHGRATFSTQTSGGRTTLTILLENLAASPKPGHVLTGIGFSIAGTPGLTFSTLLDDPSTIANEAWIKLGNGSALFVGDGTQASSQALFSGTDAAWRAGNAIGTEFGFSAVGGQTLGESVDYGIIGYDTTGVGDPPLRNHRPLVRSIDGTNPSAILLTLVGSFGDTFGELSDPSTPIFENVQFQFGSGPTLRGGTRVTIPPPPPSVPEPGTLSLLALGSIGLGGFGWRRRKATA